MDQEKLCCSICLDVKDPVRIPCGHVYCTSCIQSSWNAEKKIHSCPQCRKTFTPRPVQVKNTTSAGLTEDLKKIRLQADGGDAGPGDVSCDLCSGRNVKALRSCLQCLVSYCEEHLQPHHDVPAFQKHKLVSPSKNLQENICSQHGRLMEVFCRSDQRCICHLCCVDQHQDHDTVSAEAERMERQGELETDQERIQQRIQTTEEDVKVLQDQLEGLNRSADEAVKDSEEIFSELIRLLQKKKSDVTQQIRSQRKAEASRVQKLQKKLKQKVEELKRIQPELEKLSRVDNHVQFLHDHPSLTRLIPPADPTHIDIRPLRNFQDVTVNLSELRDQIQKILCEEPTKNILLPQEDPKTRAEFLQYSQKLTLDPNTLHTHLSLSKANRKVKVETETRPYPDHPDRFTDRWQVLSRQNLSRRSYWEVEWSGVGVLMAVAYEDIMRRGEESLFGFNDQSWSLEVSLMGSSFFHNNINTSISGPVTSRIGVYLDHGAGILSFYSVSEDKTMTLLHTVHTTFTRPVRAGFWVAIGSSAELCKLR